MPACVIAQNSKLKNGSAALTPTLSRSKPFRKTHLRLQKFAIVAAAGRTIEVTLKRPLGLILAENEAEKTVFVEEIAAGGNAEKSGLIAVGDILSKVSATTLKSGKDGSMKQGHGEYLYNNWEVGMFDCEGQTFKTIMSAIDSNNPRWGINKVTLVLKRTNSQE